MMAALIICGLIYQSNRWIMMVVRLRKKFESEFISISMVAVACLGNPWTSQQRAFFNYCIINIFTIAILMLQIDISQFDMQRSFQSQLSKCYQNRELIKLINKQILDLHYLPQVKSLLKFTIVKFKVPNITNIYRFTTDSHCIQFFIVLSKGFPATSPRVHTKESLVLPGINDCRDLLYNIIQTETWDHKITLKKIQQQIPKFLAQINKMLNIFQVARLGCFQLNHVYPMELIRQLRGDNIFFALQFTQETDFRMIVMDVSSTHITIFTTKQQPHYESDGFKIPQQKDISYCMLVFYAELGSVSEIYIDRNNFSDIHITFTAKKPHNMNLESCSKIKKIKVKKGLAFIHKLLRGIKYYDYSEININIFMDNLSEQQKLILKEIASSEQIIQRRMNIHTIKQLVDRYQAAVEYYSGRSIPYYQVYLDRITRLYQRKEVRLIMGTEIPIRQRTRTI